MEKKKFCEVGDHYVHQLWKARRKDPKSGEIIQKACCRNCMSREPIKSKRSSSRSSEEKKELNVFFANQSLVFPKHCENCGSPLDQSSVFARRSQTCHILPKSKQSGFPSVATHPANKIFMCCFDGCYGHSKYDNGDAKTRQSMTVYEKAIERFRSLENSLSLKDKLRAYKYLGLDQKELL